MALAWHLEVRNPPSPRMLLALPTVAPALPGPHSVLRGISGQGCNLSACPVAASLPRPVEVWAPPLPDPRPLRASAGNKASASPAPTWSLYFWTKLNFVCEGRCSSPLKKLPGRRRLPAWPLERGIIFSGVSAALVKKRHRNRCNRRSSHTNTWGRGPSRLSFLVGVLGKITRGQASLAVESSGLSCLNPSVSLLPPPGAPLPPAQLAPPHPWGGSCPSRQGTCPSLPSQQSPWLLCPPLALEGKHQGRATLPAVFCSVVPEPRGCRGGSSVVSW